MIAIDIALICFVSFLFLGTLLLSEYVEMDIHNTLKFEHENLIAQANITYINKGRYTCYQEQDCQKCQNGTSYQWCSYMIQHNMTGKCRSTTPLCCKEMCYYCPDDNVTMSDNMTFSAPSYCDECGEKTKYCNEYCECIQETTTPLCQILDGNCYNSTIYVSYVDYQNQVINANETHHCGFDEIQCMLDYISDLRVNQTITIKYLRSNPYKIFIKNQPKYKTKTNIKVAIAFGCIFLSCAFISFIWICYLKPFSVIRPIKNAYYRLTTNNTTTYGTINMSD